MYVHLSMHKVSTVAMVDAVKANYPLLGLRDCSVAEKVIDSISLTTIVISSHYYCQSVLY